jgi:hypothetical protein
MITNAPAAARALSSSDVIFIHSISVVMGITPRLRQIVAPDRAKWVPARCDGKGAWRELRLRQIDASVS